MERENQDLALEQIRVKAAEYRTTVLESIKYVHVHVHVYMHVHVQCTYIHVHVYYHFSPLISLYLDLNGIVRCACIYCTVHLFIRVHNMYMYNVHVYTLCTQCT